jgi:hypothetical protein
MIAFVVVYGFAVWRAGHRLSLQERQPIREAVAAARGKDERAVTAVLGVSDRQMQSYDPKVIVLDDRKELAATAEQALRAGKPLFVYVCGRNSIVHATDEKLHSKQPMLEALEHGLKADETGGTALNFAQVGRFPGTEAMFSYRVYQLGPSSAK